MLAVLLLAVHMLVISLAEVRLGRDTRRHSLGVLEPVDM